MNAEKALRTVVEDIGDMDSFIEGFKPEFWSDDEAMEAIAASGKDAEVVGRFGENVQANTDRALKVLEELVAASKHVVEVFGRESIIDDEHLEAIDKLMGAYNGPWGADPEVEVYL